MYSAIAWISLKFHQFRNRTSRKKRINEKLVERLSEDSNCMFLPNVDLTDEQVLKVLCLHMKSPNTDWTVLHLDGNRISDVGVKGITRSLTSGSCANLRSLCLSHNQFSGDAFEEISKVLRKQGSTLCSLQVLNLNGNPANVNGAKALGEALPFSSIRVLSISRCFLNAEGLYLVIKYLEKCKYLQQLWLDSNNIGTTGLEYLNDALVRCETEECQPLRLLSIYDNAITDGSEWTRFLSLIPKSNLRELNVNRNRITNAGCQGLIETIKPSAIRWALFDHLTMVTPEMTGIGKRWMKFFRSKEFEMVLIFLCNSRKQQQIDRERSSATALMLAGESERTCCTISSVSTKATQITTLTTAKTGSRFRLPPDLVRSLVEMLL